MMVSLSVSPLVELVTFGSVNPMTLAPRRFAAVSKERRVLVDGSKKSVATTLSERMVRFGSLSNFSAWWSRCMMSSRERFAMVTRLLFSFMMR